MLHCQLHLNTKWENSPSLLQLPKLKMKSNTVKSLLSSKMLEYSPGGWWGCGSNILFLFIIPDLPWTRYTRAFPEWHHTHLTLVRYGASLLVSCTFFGLYLLIFNVCIVSTRFAKRFSHTGLSRGVERSKGWRNYELCRWLGLCNPYRTRWFGLCNRRI